MERYQYFTPGCETSSIVWGTVQWLVHHRSPKIEATGQITKDFDVKRDGLYIPKL